MNQVVFAFAVQAATFGAFAWEAYGESYLEILLDKPLFDPNHSAATHGEDEGLLALGYLWLTLPQIQSQQHARHQVMLGWRPARMHHRFQKPSLLADSISRDSCKNKYSSLDSLSRWGKLFCRKAPCVSFRACCQFGKGLDRNKFDESFSSFQHLLGAFQSSQRSGEEGRANLQPFPCGFWSACFMLLLDPSTGGES